MLRSLLFALLLLSAGFASAQITIDHNDMPSSGDEIWLDQYSPDSSFSMDYSLTGTNYNWDYSNLTADSTITQAYVSSLQTPYAFYFLGLDKYGSKVFDSLEMNGVLLEDWYYFYRLNQNEMAIEGIGITYNSLPLPGYFSDDDEMYQFPLTFGRVDTSTFRFSLDLQSFAYFSTTGTRVVDVEGWGTVTTPAGSYNCLKVKSTVNSVDSIIAFGFSFPTVNERVTYSFWAEDEGFAVLEVQGRMDSGAYDVGSIQWKVAPPVGADASLPLSEESIEIFPNPVSDGMLNLEYHLNSKHKIRIELLDMGGKMIAELATGTQSPGEQRHRFDLNPYSLAKGLYLLRISGQGKAMTKQVRID